MSSIKAEDYAEFFLHCHYSFHIFPSAIFFNRGSNWVEDMWRYFSSIVADEQRWSAAFRPEANRAKERPNQKVLSYPRYF